MNFLEVLPFWERIPVLAEEYKALVMFSVSLNFRSGKPNSSLKYDCTFSINLLLFSYNRSSYGQLVFCELSNMQVHIRSNIIIFLSSWRSIG